MYLLHLDNLQRHNYFNSVPFNLIKQTLSVAFLWSTYGICCYQNAELNTI